MDNFDDSEFDDDEDEDEDVDQDAADIYKEDARTKRWSSLRTNSIRRETLILHVP